MQRSSLARPVASGPRSESALGTRCNQAGVWAIPPAYAPLPRLGSPPCHICTGTGLTACHICAETGLTPMPHLHRDASASVRKGVCRPPEAPLSAWRASSAAVDGAARRDGRLSPRMGWAPGCNLLPLVLCVCLRVRLAAKVWGKSHQACEAGRQLLLEAVRWLRAHPVAVHTAHARLHAC